MDAGYRRGSRSENHLTLWFKEFLSLREKWPNHQTTGKDRRESIKSWSNPVTNVQLMEDPFHKLFHNWLQSLYYQKFQSQTIRTTTATSLGNTFFLTVFLSPLQLLYFILCTTGLVISLLVVAFAGHHHSQASSFSCQQKGDDCVCVLDQSDPIARTFDYKGVSDCEMITGTFIFYFLLQILLNLAQALVCAAGAFIIWKDRYQVFFAGTQIRSPSTQQWQKV